MNYSTPQVASVNQVATEDQVVWYVVAVIALVALAVVIAGACALFCIARGKSFTGSWSYTNGGGSVKLGCN